MSSTTKIGIQADNPITKSFHPVHKVLIAQMIQAYFALKGTFHVFFVSFMVVTRGVPVRQWQLRTT